MRKCNFMSAMGWHLGLRPTSEWAEPYGSRGHELALVVDRRIAMGQCAPGWRVVPITRCHFSHEPVTKLGQHRKMGQCRWTIMVTCRNFPWNAQCAEQNSHRTKMSSSGLTCQCAFGPKIATILFFMY
jgi:hypothetical protein